MWYLEGFFWHRMMYGWKAFCLSVNKTTWGCCMIFVKCWSYKKLKKEIYTIYNTNKNEFNIWFVFDPVTVTVQSKNTSWTVGYWIASHKPIHSLSYTYVQFRVASHPDAYFGRWEETRCFFLLFVFRLLQYF